MFLDLRLLSRGMSERAIVLSSLLLSNCVCSSFLENDGSVMFLFLLGSVWVPRLFSSLGGFGKNCFGLEGVQLLYFGGVSFLIWFKQVFNFLGLISISLG